MKAELIDLVDVGILSGTQSEKTVTSKFVLIERNSDLSLVIGKIAVYPYHANLVAKFCEMFDVPSFWERHPDMHTISDNGYIISGGYFEFKSATESALFCGASTAYGPYNSPKLQQAVKLLPFFESITVIYK